MYRLAVVLSLAAIIISLSCALSAQQSISTELPDMPAQMIENEAFTISVQHNLAPDVQEAQMHVEMKDTNATVLDSHKETVSGTGTRQFQFHAPSHDAADRIRFAVWYGTDWRQPLAPIEYTDPIPVLTKQQKQVLKAQKAAAERWRQDNANVVEDGPCMAMLVDELPQFQADLATELSNVLQQQMQVVTLNAEEVSNRYILSTKHFHTLVLPTSRIYPVNGYRTLTHYLAQGGNIIAVGAPALQVPVRKVNGRWMDAEQMKARLRKQKPRRILYDFENNGLHNWTYGSGDDSPAEWRIDSPGADDTDNALHCVVPEFKNWNTLASPHLKNKLSEKQSVTCLWAKGGPNTTALAVEWREDDGSRWIATIPLTDHWKYYALSRDRFQFWHDCDAPGRGGPGDAFRLHHAERMTVGIATTHTPMVAGRREFWVDEIGVAANPLGGLELPKRPDIQPIEMMAPGYKFYNVANADRIEISPKQCIIPETELPQFDGPLNSGHPRPQGTGFNKDRNWRWIPLIESCDRSGLVSGTPACMVINRTGRFKNAIITSFALPEDAYQHSSILKLIGKLAGRMKDGFFLFEAGAEKYAYFPNEEMTLGATTIATSKRQKSRECSVHITVESPDGLQYEKTLPVSNGTARCNWKPDQFEHNTYQVTCELLDADDNRIDILKHPVLIWRPSESPTPIDFEDGHFTMDGQRWRAHGVNYMPSSGMAMENRQYFEYWMSKGPYDPVVIERDLQRIENIGFNCVSIFCYHRSLKSGNLLDILERCRRHNLKVNLSLRPGTPMNFQWKKMKELIQTYRLSEHNIIFAYDLAWEPTFGTYDSRKRWDQQWKEWIIERYGSLANAEESWGIAVPRTDGEVTGPSDEQLTYNGDHRVMVCAYRRFLDDLLAKRHATARRLVRSIDPNHLISFRMRRSGDPDLPPQSIAYDFRGLARSCDIMEPEGYGRTGDWHRVRRGMFTADYARCMAPDKPVMWAEFGSSAWNREKMKPDLERQKRIAEFYNRFYRMAYQSDVDGTVCWFYPGGYRVGENSDFGIINPDGSWRPVTWTINKWTEKMTGPRLPNPTDVWLTIDRDATVKGVVGVYSNQQQQYWSLVEAERNPGLRQDGYGFNSATAPAVAVGNVPYVAGKTPHKYLNAEFDSIKIKKADDKWQRVTDGSVVRINKGEPVIVRATIGNNGIAKWLSDGPKGQVGLTCTEAFKPISEDVSYMGSLHIHQFQVCTLKQTMNVTLQMKARPNITFGEKVEVTLKAQ